jgi:hypothetical protein
VTEAAPASPPRPDLPPPDTDRNVTPGQRNAVQALAESASAAKARLEPLKGQVTGEAGDPKAAQARVRPDPTRLAGMRGNGVAVGNVQLRTKTRVHIDGIAPWAAGDWYLTKVNHVFSRERINNRFRSSYFTKITATL